MRKIPKISHYLTIDALIKGEEVNGRNGYDKFKCSRVSNIITEARNYGVEIEENVIVLTDDSWYKPYRLIQTQENLSKAMELRERYKSIVESHEAKRSGKKAS